MTRFDPDFTTELAEFYDATNHPVYGIVLRILGNAVDAEEVTLDIYTQIWRKAANFDETRGSVLTWLMAIARTRAIDRLRSGAGTRKRKELLEEARQTSAASTDVPLIGREVRVALNTLAPEQRESIGVLARLQPIGTGSQIGPTAGHNQDTHSAGYDETTLSTRVVYGMTPHGMANDDVRELASLFVASALPPAEADQFRLHLESCRVCAEETRSFEEAISLLPLSGTATPAPAHVREKLLTRIGRQNPPDCIRIVRAQEGEWFPLVPGVIAKRLYEESPGQNVALLVKMEAGAVYPPHEHADVEHCYVQSGDLHFGDLVLRAGDYQCAAASSVHVKSDSESGCTALIIASQQNRFLPWNR